ncbi:MAG: HIRAN domain-containing protein, partial [Magnetococcales bacterium]|nr:HIRAN domain-containing protein [Magnetococcales bacterium]
LEHRRLPKEVASSISNFSLLGYAEAKLPGDGFYIVPDFEEWDGPCEFLTEIAGFRHNEGMSMRGLDVGERVEFVANPENKYDPLAIEIIASGKLIGHVNRVLTNGFHRWLNLGFPIKAVIDRINGTLERPVYWLFVEIGPLKSGQTIS